MMSLEEISYSIMEEIDNFQYKHSGMLPDCIFMSTPLIRYISRSGELAIDYNIENDGLGKVGRYQGINIIEYDYPKPQYYLASGPGMFRAYYKATEVVL